MGGEACVESRCVEIPTKGIPGDIEAIMVIAWLSGFAAAGAAGVFGGMTLAGKKQQIPIPPKLAHIAFGLAAFSMTFFLIRMLSEKAERSWAGFPAIGGVILAGAGLKQLSPFLSVASPQAQQAAFLAQPTMPSLPPGQHGNQSQPMQPYGNQSQPMQPYGQQGSQPYPQAQQSQPMQPYGQQGSQPYQQPHQQSQPYQQPQMAPPHQPPPQVHNCPRCGTQLQFVAQYQRWYCPREQQYL